MSGDIAESVVTIFRLESIDIILGISTLIVGSDP
jgi:hypothetical protein